MHTFPRVFGKYVREEKILNFQEAIRKMSSLPAQKFSLWDRGLIREGGMQSYITTFNPHKKVEKKGRI